MDHELDLEQKYLELVRQFMEESEQIRLKELFSLEQQVETLYQQSRGTFSQEYELTVQALQIARSRQQKGEESRDKPYFGRIDFRPRLALAPEHLYIGKHAVRETDASNDYVIDWRAPVAELYYSGTLGRNEFLAPGGFMEGDLTLKRRFTYTDEAVPRIDRYFDEGDQILIASEGSEGKTLQDEFLRINLEGSSTKKLKEIVATIAREQNAIIRAPKNIPIIVQGAAGAGKTTVALHRLAYLLYLHQATLKGSDVCIIAPNRLFLDYISEVLPDLGTKDVLQTTLEDIILKELKIKKFIWNKDEILKSILEADPQTARIHSEISRIKGTPSFMRLLDAMKDRAEAAMARRGPVLLAGEVLYSGDEIRRLLLEDLVYLPLNERRGAIETYLKRNLKDRAEKVGIRIDQRYQEKVRTIKRHFAKDELLMRRHLVECYQERDEILKHLTAMAKSSVKEYFLDFKELSVLDQYEESLKDRDFVRDHLQLEGELLEGVCQFDRNQIQADDLSALMYLSMLLNGTRHSWSHVVVDEAQDYTMLQLEVIRRLARQDSLTLVGDLAQGIYSYRAIKDWQEANQLFKSGAAYYELRNSYRSTVEIIREANRTLHRMQLPLKEAIPVLRHGRIPQHSTWSTSEELAERLKEVEAIMQNDQRNTLALVTKTFEEAAQLHRLLKKQFPQYELIDVTKRKSSLSRVIIPSYLTKGLEFDAVVLLDEPSFGSDPLDLRLKYVALTRALHLEFLFERLPT